MGNNSSNARNQGEMGQNGEPGAQPLPQQPQMSQDSGEYQLQFKTESQFQTFTFDTETKNFYGLLTASAPEYQEENRPAIDVVCVLDVSGSMTGAKISLVRKSMRRLVRNLGAKDRCAFVTFDSNVKTVMNFTVMDANGKARARELVKKLRPGSSTNLCGGLKTGIEMMKNDMQNEVTSVLLFTDGEANVGITTVDGIVQEALAATGGNLKAEDVRKWTPAQVADFLTSINLQIYADNFVTNGVDGEMLFGDLTKDMLTQELGVKTLHLAKFERELQKLRDSTSREGEAGPEKHIQVNTFGFGSSHNVELLERIANTFDGMYFFMQDEESIISGFANCLGGMLSTVAQEINVTFRPSGNVGDFKIHKDDHTTQNDDGSWTVHFGDLQSEEERHILASCTLPALNAPDSDFIMYTADIRYNNLVTKTQGGMLINCVVNRSGVEDGLNEHVDEAKNRVIATEAMAAAEQLGNRNDFQGAQNLLSVAYETINKSASKSSPFCRKIVADLHTAESRVTDRTTWNNIGQKYMSQNIACHKMERAVNFKSSEYASQDLYNTRSKQVTLNCFEDEDSDDSVDCNDDWNYGVSNVNMISNVNAIPNITNRNANSFANIRASDDDLSLSDDDSEDFKPIIKVSKA